VTKTQQKTLGQKIRELRGDRTQRDCAVAADWGPDGQARWSELETGRSGNPTLETLKAVSKALGCKIDDLI